MERLIILVIWALGTAFIRDANKKNNEGKTKKTARNQKGISWNLNDMKNRTNTAYSKERQISEGPARSAQPARPTQASTLSDLPKAQAPSKPKAPPKPAGLEIDLIGGDKEIGGIKEAGISIGSKYNNLELDLKRDLLKGIIYSEILSEPKSIRNMKRRR